MWINTLTNYKHAWCFILDLLSLFLADQSLQISLQQVTEVIHLPKKMECN